MSPGLPPSSRTDKAASMSGRSARALKNWIASKRFDFPVPFAPATHVKGPKRTSTSTRFLKPETFRRVSISPLQTKLDFIQLRSIAECISEAFQQCAWDFNQISLLLGHGKMEMLPH